MAISDLEKFTIKFGRIIARNANRIERVVLKEVQGLMLRRIFNRGEDVDGNKIGTYSTNDILIGASSFRTKTAAGKVLGSKKNRKKLDWVTYKNRRLAVLEGGYKELRRLQGLRYQSADLMYRGDLFKSIQVGTSGGDNVIGFINDKQRTIGRANEGPKRFDTSIFAISNKELKAADKAFLKEFDAIISKNLK